MHRFWVILVKISAHDSVLSSLRENQRCTELRSTISRHLFRFIRRLHGGKSKQDFHCNLRCLLCSGAGGAGLEVYCYNSTRRYCRSGWLCPWRDITDAACAAGYGLAECSVSGLTDTSMADAQGTHRIRTDRRRRRRSWFFSRRRRRATYACAGPAAGKITCNIGAVDVENPAHTALWTLGQSGQSCTDACGGSCIETSWPHSEEEFKVSVGTITSECARISDGNGHVHPSMHQSDRRCWVNFSVLRVVQHRGGACEKKTLTLPQRQSIRLLASGILRVKSGIRSPAALKTQAKTNAETVEHRA